GGGASAVEKSGGLGGVVGEDEIRAGAADGGQHLQDDALTVDPPPLGGSVDHRVLTRDVVGRDRNVHLFADAVDDVQVAEGGLHHHHVGALLEIETDLLEALADVGGIHLVATA